MSVPAPDADREFLILDVTDLSAQEGYLLDIAFDEMRSECLLHLTRVVAKIASRLTREFWDATPNINIRESGIFKLFWEREVVLHALVGLLKKGGQFTPESCSIIECIKKVDNKWGNRFFTLELLLSKIKPPLSDRIHVSPGRL
jgi:hypothetical protein